MHRRIYYLLFVTFFGMTTGCLTMSEKNSGKISARDFVGEWEGSLPCADCDAVDYDLTLNKDKTYEATINYLGVGQAEPSRTSGTWEISEDRILIMDKELKDTLLLLPENGSLIVLGPLGQRMNGPEAKYYKLVRNAEAINQVPKDENEFGFRASSNEPAWNLEMIFDKYIRFYTPDGDTVAVPLPEVQTDGTSSLKYVASGDGHSLDVSVMRDSCDLNGAFEPYTVRVIVDQDKTYIGCGAYAYDKSLSGKWEMVRVNGEIYDLEATEKMPVINVGANGMSVSGNTGCNSFNGMLWVEGRKIRVNGISLTRKVCTGNLESLFLDLLESRPSFSIEGKRLVLEGEGTTFTLMRSESP